MTASPCAENQRLIPGFTIWYAVAFQPYSSTSSRARASWLALPGEIDGVFSVRMRRLRQVSLESTSRRGWVRYPDRASFTPLLLTRATEPGHASLDNDRDRRRSDSWLSPRL